MRLAILEALEILNEDGEGGGMTAGAIGDAAIASAVGGPSASSSNVNTTADVAMYPQYLGMSFRGGRMLKMHNKKRKVAKRKGLLEEALSHHVGEMFNEMNQELSKSPQFEGLLEES